ncbi:Methyltransferase domain-containing protein [Sanguibacter gelidistatuariae]|uniref:Methyltransferase domain-containing protein n=1 Tax=Sanguibacter gelidistatuariae TaxID=1814289 RepID=A0A1G6NWL6_9MICO|nr:fused MFS/spermidine synthase [Sanguibacter gelidistatuariae]SDC72189.1 Methyltransferase domain-containing protein [Sanguibacter gelidistatuariae]
MARRASRNSSSTGPLTKRSTQPALPVGPIETDSGSVELVPDRDDPRALTVMINGVPSSFIDLDDPRNVGFEYMDIMCAVLDHTRTGPLDVVHLGAAGCAMARSIDATRPGSRQIGIDIDARLIELARTWFDLPRSPRLRLRAGDARAQLATLPAASADVVIRDVFAGDTTPAHLLTVEFVGDVLRVLRPGGIYLINCADRPPLDGARSEVATLRTALQAALDSVPDSGAGPATDARGEIGVVSEPALLKSRRYGNLVLVLVAPSRPEAGAPEPGDGVLGSAALGRALRTLAVPAQLLHTDPETTKFAGQARVLRDVVQST